MKAILEFDLDDYHERLAHRRAISATQCYLVFHDVFNDLRQRIKYSNDQDCNNIEFENETYTVKQLENFRDYLEEMLGDRKINMDDLE